GLRLSGEGGALALVPVASEAGEAPAQYRGNNRVVVTVEGRPVEVAVRRWGSSQSRLARDLAAFLNGDSRVPAEALRPHRYVLSWPLVLPLLPLGIVALGWGSWKWAPLGVGLSVLCWALLWQERLPLKVRS